MLSHVLLLLALCLTHGAALLETPHFEYSFLLSGAHTPLLPRSSQCGSNLGSDRIDIDFTATPPGSSGLPVSPAFYYFDGSRCRARGRNYGAYFLLHDGPNTDVLSEYSPALTDLARQLADAAGDDSVVTMASAHLSNDGRAQARMHEHVTVERREGTARLGRRTGEMVPGAVQCGVWAVRGAVFVKAGGDVDVQGKRGKTGLGGGRMYAAVETEEGVCWFEGSSRAPAEAIEDGELQGGIGEFGSDGGGRVGIIVGAVGGVLGLGVLLVGGVLVAYRIAKRREERKEEGEDEGGGDGGVESEGV